MRPGSCAMAWIDSKGASTPMALDSGPTVSDPSTALTLTGTARPRTTSVMSLGGPGTMKTNHTPEQTFYIGTMSHDNPYDFVTLKNVRSFQSTEFQKGQGQDFWKWVEGATFNV